MNATLIGRPHGATGSVAALLGLVLVACSTPTAPPAATTAPATTAPATPAPASPGAGSPASPIPVPTPASAAPASAASPSAPAVQVTGVFGSPSPGAVVGPAQTVRIGLSTSGAVNAGVYVAEGLGFFAEQGINLQYVSFPSASDIIPAISRGDLDVADAGINPATFNALARNVGMKLVADKGSQPPGYAINIFVVAKDLAGTIKGPADLKGRKVAVTPPGLGTATGFALSKYLAQANLTPDDVDIVSLSFPDQVAALTNRSVDAALMAEPFASAVIGNGAGALLTTMDKVDPGQQISSIVYTDQFIGSGGLTTVRWMIAYIKGIRAYLAAFSQGTDRDRVIQILAQKTDIKDPQVWAKIYPVGLNPNGSLNVRSINDSLAYFQKLGLVQTAPNIGAVLDNSYAQAAVQALGPAPTPAPPRQ